MSNRTPEPAAANAVLRAIEKREADLAAFFLDAFTALSVNGISGDYVEFGSMGGGSFVRAHEVLASVPTGRHLWAFDSFVGLPDTEEPLDAHPSFPPSVDPNGLDAFVARCDAHGIPRDDYTTVPGFYEETLPAIGADGDPGDVALAYIDCNLYSSTVTVLDFLAPRLKHGMILAFDDYFCWSAEEVSGERIALDEFLRAHPEWHLLRFKDPAWGAVSFVVERVPEGTSPRLP